MQNKLLAVYNEQTNAVGIWVEGSNFVATMMPFYVSRLGKAKLSQKYMHTIVDWNLHWTVIGNY